MKRELKELATITLHVTLVVVGFTVSSISGIIKGKLKDRQHV